MKRACIICDIDGVYTDSREWNKFAPEKHDDRQGWDEFSKHIDVCKPNKPIIRVLIFLHKVLPIIFLTSREDTLETRKATLNQIKDFSNGKLDVEKDPNILLYMRNYKDYRRSYIVKEEILKGEILPNYYPLLALDDEKGNIEMFKRNDISTIHYTKLRNKN